MGSPKRRVASIILAVLLCGTTAPPLQAEDHLPGHFQLTVGLDGTLFILDTTSGQCWSKRPGGKWVDEGNPNSRSQPVDEAPVKLNLPDKKVEITVKQRRAKSIPGSDEKVMVKVDDITGGQVLISINRDTGVVVLDDVSVRQGEVVSFDVSRDTFYLRVKELRNFVIGEDFAVLEIAANRDALDSIEREDEATKSDPQVKQPEKR
jgi:hypothetical protein